MTRIDADSVSDSKGGGSEGSDSEGSGGKVSKTKSGRAFGI